MFITFEGPEGAGKTTLIQGLKQKLESLGKSVVVTREPGGGEFGASIRKLLLEGDEISTPAELFLFLADRAENIDKIVKPAMQNGSVVLCDRHADSTVVYQGYARGFNLDQLRMLNALATNNLKPDLTFLLDLNPEIGLKRQTKQDRLDRESLDFHQKVRNGFLAESKIDPDRWCIVDAEKNPEEVFEVCWNRLQSSL